MKWLRCASVTLVACVACSDGASDGIAGGDGDATGATDVLPVDVHVDAGAVPGTDADAGGGPGADADALPGEDVTGLDVAVAPDTSADAGAGDASVDDKLPGTPVGERVAWLIGVINDAADGTVLTKEEFEANFSADFQANTSYYAFKAAILVSLAKKHAPLVVEGWEDTATDTALWAKVHGTKSDTWLRIGARVDEAAPHAISEVFRVVAPDLDPAIGPIPPTHLGLFVYDPHKGESTVGFAVELVDRATGESFEPAVSAVVDDKYGYVRLPVPAGSAEVGVKVTHSDGQVTYTFAPTAKPGEDYRSVFAFPKEAFPSYVAGVGVTLEAGKAQLWGQLAYEVSGRSLWSLEPYDAGIGCATVSSEPALDRIYYTVPPNYLPAEAAASTALQNSTWFAFNVEPSATTFTAQATGAPNIVEDVPLAADAVTLVYMPFFSATYPENPTAADCE